MAATALRARAGSSFRANIKLWQAGQTEPVDTSQSTFQFILRRPGTAKQVFCATEIIDSAPSPTAVLARIGVGEWQLFLGKTLTQGLPTSCRFEFRLTSIADPEDSMVVCSGVLNIERQA